MTAFTSKAARREFLRRSAALGSIGAVNGGGALAFNLATAAEAAAQGSAADDYKALVCVFLLGAMDNGNTLVPVDEPTYADYANWRTTLALPHDTLLATTLTPSAVAPALPGARRYALAPELSRLAGLFAQGKAAVQLNVGPLLAPLTLQQYRERSAPVPPKLFSHNDQQSVWQSNLPEGATSGWGGRIADLFAADNGRAVFTAVSAAGNAVMVSGREVAQYQVSPAGSVRLASVRNRRILGSTHVADAVTALARAAGSNAFESAYAGTVNRAIAADTELTSALLTVPADLPAFAGIDLGANRLAAQLHIVARMIGARTLLRMRRQVFFVSLGGWDHHDNLLTDLPILHARLDAALGAFQQAMDDLQVADRVTTFTASDFGRTIAGNGDGSDHGWGSHQFVLGGAVQGARFYGTDVSWQRNGPDDVGAGRLLPTTAVDQYAGALARWFGVSATDLPLVFPDIGRFDAQPPLFG